MAIKGILFDLDGTLCNTLEDLADATNGVLIRHGFDARPVENFKQYVGNGAKMQLKRAIGQEIENPLFETMLSEYLADYGVGYLKKTAPYDGILETVKALYAKDLVLTVVTNKPQIMATNIVKELFGNMFCGVWGNNPDFPLKPDPAMTLHVMEELHLLPEETLFVGDSGVDMLTANNAGLTAVGVSWGFRGREELQNAGAHCILNHPSELLDLLNG